MLITDSLLNSAAALISRGIRESERAGAIRDELIDRSLVVEAAPLPRPIRCVVTAAGIELSAATEPTADVEISGSLIELSRLLLSDTNSSLREGRITIKGDAELADRYRELLIAARPDLEEKLGKLVGKPVAFQFANLFFDAREGLQDWVADLADNLHEDDGLMPREDELAAHFDSIDSLVTAVDRLEARVRLLQERSPR